MKHFIETDFLGFRKLAIVNLREQKKRLVKLAHILQSLVGLHDFAHLLLGEGLVLHEHLQTVLTDRYRCLYFVRGITDELFLLLEYFFAMDSKAVHCHIQFTELCGICRIVQRLVLLVQTEIIQPFQQKVKRLHDSMKHPYINKENGNQQRGEKSYQQIKDGFPQIFLLDSRGIDGNFEIAFLPVLEEGSQNSCRLTFPFFFDINH